MDTVLINGKIVMENRKLLTIDENEVMQKVREIAVKVKNSLQKQIFYRYLFPRHSLGFGQSVQK